MATTIIDAHKLEPEFKKQWVKALRSGKYTQGSTRLWTTIGHCCLGVAEALMLDKTGNRWEGGYQDLIPETSQHVFIHVLKGKTDCEEDTAATPTLCELTNLSPLGSIPKELHEEVHRYISERFVEIIPQSANLAAYNDLKVPFSIIADVIEIYF